MDALHPRTARRLRACRLYADSAMAQRLLRDAAAAHACCVGTQPSSRHVGQHRPPRRGSLRRPVEMGCGAPTGDPCMPRRRGQPTVARGDPGTMGGLVSCGRSTAAVDADRGWARDTGTEAQTLPGRRPCPGCWDQTLVSAPVPPVVVVMVQLARTTRPSRGVMRRPAGVSAYPAHTWHTRDSRAQKVA